MERLARSAVQLEFVHSGDAVAQALQNCITPAPGGGLRIRLVLWRDGRIETTVVPLVREPQGTVWRVAIAARRLHSAMPKLRHKTTHRALYDDELAHAVATCNADEVIFLNERRELCEGARSNLFVRHGSRLLTPPVSCGLLPGVLRAQLLACGEAAEAVLTQDDLGKGGIFMGNSVRGLVAAQIVGAHG